MLVQTAAGATQNLIHREARDLCEYNRIYDDLFANVSKFEFECLLHKDIVYAYSLGMLGKIDIPIPSFPPQIPPISF